MKYRVPEDVTIDVSTEGVNKDGEYTFTTKPQSFKAGQYEVTDKNRAALERLADMGLAELVKSAKESE